MSRPNDSPPPRAWRASQDGFVSTDDVTKHVEGLLSSDDLALKGEDRGGKDGKPAIAFGAKVAPSSTGAAFGAAKAAISSAIAGTAPASSRRRETRGGMLPLPPPPAALVAAPAAGAPAASRRRETRGGGVLPLPPPPAGLPGLPDPSKLLAMMQQAKAEAPTGG